MEILTCLNHCGSTCTPERMIGVRNRNVQHTFVLKKIYIYCLNALLTRVNLPSLVILVHTYTPIHFQSLSYITYAIICFCGRQVNDRNETKNQLITQWQRHFFQVFTRKIHGHSLRLRKILVSLVQNNIMRNKWEQEPHTRFERRWNQTPPYQQFTQFMMVYSNLNYRRSLTKTSIMLQLLTMGV